MGTWQACCVLDEFQYMIEVDEPLSSRLQRSIDARPRECNMMLMLCGSTVSFFKRRLLGYRAPLYGRTAENACNSQAAGIDPRSVTRYVELLEELWILKRVRPLGGRRPVQLRFRDNFFRFWFTFVLLLRYVLSCVDPRRPRGSWRRTSTRTRGGSSVRIS